VIDGIETTVDREAVVVTAREPLAVLSSAYAGGGFASARAIVNLHVPKNLHQEDSAALLPAFVDRRRIPGPWVGLLTAAWTERAEVAEEQFEIASSETEMLEAGEKAVAALLPEYIEPAGPKPFAALRKTP